MGDAHKVIIEETSFVDLALRVLEWVKEDQAGQWIPLEILFMRE